MEEVLVKYDTAKLAKEKGFDATLRDFSYTGEGKLIGPSDRVKFMMEQESLNKYFELTKEFINAPMQSILQKWLREHHDIHVNPNCSYTKSNKFLGYNLFVISGKYKYLGEFVYGDTYEEVLEVGLQEALKLITIEEEN